jgi:mono/diheme cytochrome c family protein
MSFISCAARAYRVPLTLALLTLSAVGTPARAGDARHGATISQRWCAECHVVSGDQSSAFADAPSFGDIARRRPDRKEIANFLANPHPPMPDMHLSRGEIDDIVTYIRSLDPRPAPRDGDGKDAPLPKNG